MMANFQETLKALGKQAEKGSCGTGSGSEG